MDINDGEDAMEFRRTCLCPYMVGNLTPMGQNLAALENSYIHSWSKNLKSGRGAAAQVFPQ